MQANTSSYENATKNHTSRLSDNVARFSDNFTDSEIDDFLNLLYELVCVIDQNGRFLRLNAAAQKALGIQAAGIHGFSFFSLVDIDFLPMVRGRLQDALADPYPVQFTAAFRIRPDQVLWIKWTVVRSKSNTSLLAAGRGVSEQIHLNGQQKNAMRHKTGCQHCHVANTKYLALSSRAMPIK